MGSIVTILCGVAKALGLVDDLMAALKSHQDKMAGMATQAAADTTVTLAAVARERDADAQASQTNQEAIDRLRSGKA